VNNNGTGQAICSAFDAKILNDQTGYMTSSGCQYGNYAAQVDNDPTR
jgi:hypothetical protein